MRFSPSIILLIIFLSGCISDSGGQQLVVYTSRDQYFSEPVLLDFEAQTGIKVLAVYDTGATKTAGIVNRIIAESNNPRADVFWNSEISRTLLLKRKGLLSAYISPNTARIPSEFKDPEGYWTGFGARARVFIYNKDLISEDQVPESIFDLEDPAYKGMFCVGKPWLGTMATHNAIIFLSMGDEGAKEHFINVRDNGAVVLVGNSAVRNAVGKGRIPFGIIDTSDALEAINYGMPVGIKVPDQGKDHKGAVLIPNTIALIKGARNEDNAKKFIDYMLSRQVEENLAKSISGQIPLGSDVEVPDSITGGNKIVFMKTDYVLASQKMETSNRALMEIFN